MHIGSTCQFEGRVALVTGATRGIGAVTACAFARAGATVIANVPRLSGPESPSPEASRAENAPTAELIDAVEKWRDEAGLTAEQVIPLAASVDDPRQVEEMFNAVQERFGGLDILVNNAGINRDRTVARMTDEEWRRVLAVNLDGAFYCARAAIPLLKDGGRIISLSSVVAHTGNFGVANYAASKAGLLGLTKSLSLELARRQITVNAVCPGFIQTEMTAGMPPDVLEQITAQIPLARRGMPEDVAECILFLASPGAGYITGESLNVNGGLHRGS